MKKRIQVIELQGVCPQLPAITDQLSSKEVKSGTVRAGDPETRPDARAQYHCAI